MPSLKKCLYDDVYDIIPATIKKLTSPGSNLDRFITTVEHRIFMLVIETLETISDYDSDDINTDCATEEFLDEVYEATISARIYDAFSEFKKHDFSANPISVTIKKHTRMIANELSEVLLDFVSTED